MSTRYTDVKNIKYTLYNIFKEIIETTYNKRYVACNVSTYYNNQQRCTTWASLHRL